MVTRRWGWCCREAHDRCGRPEHRDATRGCSSLGVPVLGHLLRHAVDDVAAAAETSGRRPSVSTGTRSSTSTCPTPLFEGLPGAVPGVGEPRRLRHDAATGLRRRGHERECAGGRHAGRIAAALRPAVPPGGGAHRARQRHPPPLRLRRLRLPRRLDDGVVRRRGGRAHSTAGGGRPCGLRAQRRRGLDRGRRHPPPGGRRPPDLHLRRQRPAAAGRGDAGRAPVRGQAAPAGGRRRCPRRCSSSGWPGVVDPEEKRKIIGRTFIDVFEERAQATRARSTTWRRARSIPTSSRASRSWASRRRSRAITTSAGCRTACASRSWSRSASCSRTRCGSSGSRSASTRTSSGGSRSRVRGWPCASLGEVTESRLDLLRRADAIVRRRGPEGRMVPAPLAVLRRAAARAERGCDGRRADVRVHHRGAGRREPRRHDRRLGAAAARPARVDVARAS